MYFTIRYFSDPYLNFNMTYIFSNHIVIKLNLIQYCTFLEGASTNLCDFPHNTGSPAQASMSDQHCLQCPTKKMSKCKDVTMSPKSIPCYLRAVHCIFLGKQQQQNSKKQNYLSYQYYKQLTYTWHGKKAWVGFLSYSRLQNSPFLCTG